MDRVETMLQSVLASLSRLLDPAMLWLARLDFAVRHQLGQFGVPYQWAGVIVTAAWVIVVFMVIRVVANWLKLLILLVVALVAMKAYGFLPEG